jgi:DNA-binding transcriptional regulator YiaG
MLGESIRKARVAAGLSKGEVARRLGVTWLAVHFWERGLRKPSTDHLLALMRLFPDLSAYLSRSEGGKKHGAKRAKR